MRFLRFPGQVIRGITTLLCKQPSEGKRYFSGEKKWKQELEGSQTVQKEWVRLRGEEKGTQNKL